MFDVNKAIYACDDVICRNIESFTTEQRGLLSQNILSQLRNFVENIFVKVYISWVENLKGRTMIPFGLLVVM